MTIQTPLNKEQKSIDTIQKENTIQTDLLSINNYDLESTMQAAEKNIELVKRIKKLALSVTNHHDWVDQQGKPYLQSSGCEKIRPLFNISWEAVEYIRHNEENGHFSYTVMGFFMMGGQRISVMGARSTKDPFFKRYEKDSKGNIKLDEYGNKIEQPNINIDATDVQKAAYSNFIMQGIVRILGIRNLTYEELEEYTGITASNITQVKYKTATKKTSSTNNSNGAASEKQINFLRTLLANAGLKGKEVSAINELKILARKIKSAADLTSQEASTLIKHFSETNK